MPKGKWTSNSFDDSHQPEKPNTLSVEEEKVLEKKAAPLINKSTEELKQSHPELFKNILEGSKMK